MGQLKHFQAETRKPRRRYDQSFPNKKNELPRFPWKWLMVFLAGLSAMVFFGKRPFIVFDEYEQPSLAPWRKDKMWRELDNLGEAEQYVLIAQRDEFYPCFNCSKNSTIFLLSGEVWKYGVTRKGKAGRYNSAWLKSKGLKFYVQFRGTLSQCLKEEKRKIYFYAILPENLARERPLIRPPGNKIDN